MKWRTKFSTCSLLAGLTALMLNGCTPAPPLQLLASKNIDFPAASGIEFFRDTLYVFGDNAKHLLLLTSGYEPAGTYPYDNSKDPVLHKDVKPDIESALIMEQANGPVLMGIGSMSGSNRWPVFSLTIGQDTLTKTRLFKPGITFNGISEINMEGSTAFGNDILLCNRANLTTRKNHLLLWNRTDSITVKEAVLPATASLPGLSGLYYVKEKDLLLFTASEEATASAYEDGDIGHSYLGWIANFSSAWKNGKLLPDGFLTLADYDKAFAGQKIESVCMETYSGESYWLHLAADNDDGKTVLFKIKLNLYR